MKTRIARKGEREIDRYRSDVKAVVPDYLCFQDTQIGVYYLQIKL